MASVIRPDSETETRFKRAGAAGSAPPGTPIGVPIGELLQRTGVLSEQDVRRVMRMQQERHLPFGEAALQLGLLSEQDIDRALSKQFDYPYVTPDQSNLDASLYAAYQPFDAPAESLRNLRSQLMLRWFTEPHRALVLVGTRAGAGCSTLAANLAISFAQLGERTLLIDANLRTPRQHRLFGLEMEHGLSGLLGGRHSIHNAAMSVSAFPQLSVLCAGHGVPNPQELLGRHTFAYFMETWPARFDVVIIDTPPALDYADAQLVTARAGAALLVTRRDQTRLTDIAKLKEQLQLSGAALLGAVVNPA